MGLGRSRRFDEDEALGRAMEVFWRRGYEGATLDELTAAMRINRPSLYAAFGNKEQLFRKALARYCGGPYGFVRECLAEPMARGVAERLLRGILRVLGDPGYPGGCLLVQGALASGAEADAIRRELAEERERTVAAITERFERGMREGDLPEGTDCAGLARYVATVMHGLSVQSAGGASMEELGSAVDLALRAWPSGG